MLQAAPSCACLCACGCAWQPTVATKQDEINLNAAALGANKEDSEEGSSDDEA